MADGSRWFPWERRSIDVVLQAESAECGLACIAMLARYHGYRGDLAALRRKFSVSARGAGLARLIEVSAGLGFDARALRVDLDHLGEIRGPCILHWNFNHFVVLESVRRGIATIHDPARGTVRLRLSEIGRSFTGIVLEVTPRMPIAAEGAEETFSLYTMLRSTIGFRRVLLQVLCIALAVEVSALLLPLQLQWAVDEIVPAADGSFLVVTSLVFSCAVLFRTALLIARGWLVTWLSATLNIEWINALVRHLLYLPLDFFARRGMGEMISRISSVQHVQSTITGSFFETILDAAFASVALVALVSYSGLLTVVVLGVLALYASSRVLMFKRLWAANARLLADTAKQQSEIIETIGTIQAIKLGAREDERRARIHNSTIEATNRAAEIQRINLAFNTAGQGLFSLQRVVVIGAGTHMVMSGDFTIGMLVAYVAFAEQLGLKLIAVTDRFAEFSMLRLHAGRIADIVSHPPERFLDGHGPSGGPCPAIVVRNVSFRYSDDEPWILRNLSMSIPSGAAVGVVGRSGCGKSTLIKLIAGLLVPTEGSIEIDGVDIRNFGLRRYRSQIGCVMQDDNLFAASIADNISFFDPEATTERIEWAAKAAAIHEEIRAMPMRYETVLGDSGSLVSGGQRQRILIARALYGDARVLIFDEATSHLDAGNERNISLSISKMGATRIVVAHRAETLQHLDTLVDISCQTQKSGANI